MEILKPDQLTNLASTPNWADAGHRDRHALIVDLREIELTGDETIAAIAWLQQQAIPTIGISAGTASLAGEKSLADGLDLLAADEQDARTYLACIDAHPDAAAILVQVVRGTTTLPLRPALAMESLGYSTLLGGQSFRDWLAERATPAERMLDNPLLVTRNGNEIDIALNNPAQRNAVCMAMRDALAEVFQLVMIDQEISTAVVSGKGPAFCAGGDLTEFGLASDLAYAHRIRQQRMPGQYVGMVPEKFRFELHGACIGAGIEIPAFAGHVVASPDAWFQLPEIEFGLIPGAGGCVSIPRRIGRHRMNELALTGRRLSATEALEWNLIDAISENNDPKQ